MLSLDDIRRQALEDGDELVINGRSFNRSRDVVSNGAKPKIAAVLAQPKPEPSPAPPSITADDVARLLADRDAAWQTQSESVTQAFARAIEAIPRPLPNSPTPSRWVFTPKYDMRGRYETLTAEPKYD